MATSPKMRRNGNMRLQQYARTYGSDGQWHENVWMDQYGRIMKMTTDSKGKAEWTPTGTSGYASH